MGSPAIGVHPEMLLVNRHAQERCAFFRSMQSGARLPDTSPEALPIALRYLDNVQDCHSLREDAKLLLRFAHAWTLATKLGTPELQNSLLDDMTEIYLGTKYLRQKHPRANQSRLTFSTSQYVNETFHHLEQSGPRNEADKFWICFVGRSSHHIKGLDLELRNNNVGRGTFNEIIAQGQLLDDNIIDHAGGQFRIDLLRPRPFNPPEKTCRILRAVFDLREAEDQDKSSKSNEFVFHLPQLASLDYRMFWRRVMMMVTIIITNGVFITRVNN
ncbi:hypothetical protein P154DRAFT_583030 [Amniculicola lignicola CBS 123094]|uniref:Uncharacterized protein n=1 Tax=Amniculicola lignicola CBS 123094 TaxID=1392246 RepID=A0A6A5VWG6_9PLEO|nr:hypothetical protein P154DRAFT_583030 [Amniculicola lignicola CBS 123094]